MASFASLENEDTEKKKLIQRLNLDSKSGSPYLARRTPQDVREAIRLYSIYTSREPTTSLSKAVCEDDIETVQAYLTGKKDGRSLDELDRNGFTALHYAAQNNRSAITDLLLDSGANIDTRGDLGMTALMLACKHGCEQTAVGLLKHGADSSLCNNQKCSPLHLAALTGNKNIVQVLLKNDKTEVNAADMRKATPLYNACSLGHEEICELLIDRGSHLNSVTVDRLSPLHAAASEGSVKVVKLLLDKAIQSGYSVKELLHNEEFSGSVLHAAVLGGNIEVVEFLLSRGAEATATDKSPVNVLHVAACNGSQKMIESLLSKGVNVNVRDNQNQTPLHSASSMDRVEAIKTLHNGGASLDLKDKNGMTPFLLAVFTGNKASAALLLELGTDFAARDNRLRSCIHAAVENEDITMLNLLLQETGSDLLNTRDIRGRTPLHYAALSRKHELTCGKLIGILSTEDGNLRILEALLRKCTASTLSIKDERQKTPLHLAAECNKHKIVKQLLQACVKSAHHVDEMGRIPLHYAAMTGRRKVCSTLLKCKEEINSVDVDHWSPLLWAAKSGSVETVQLLLEMGAASNTCDVHGNTALHVASFHGHVNVINFLLDYGVEILVNHDGLNCLDYAIENELQLAVRALVQHSRWKEVFQSRGGGQRKNLLGKLIETFPAAAEIVFDQCIQRVNNRRSIDYTVIYDFRLLDPEPQQSRGTRRFFGLWELLKQKQNSLLSHPLPRMLLFKKWYSFGLPVFILNYILYLLCVICLTIFMLVQRRGAKFQGSLFTKDIDDFKPANRFNIMVNFVGLVLLLINMLKELYEIYLKRLAYFTDIQNLVDWTVYITGFLFLLSFAANIRLLKKGQLAWQLGTVCIFLAYMNLILQTRIFQHLGLYVTMFIEVVKTLVRVFAVFMMFILAYSLVFFILFKEQEPFRSFGKSVVKTTVMTIGEFDYTNMLIDGLGQSNNYSGIRAPLVPFPNISNTFFFIFMLTMPIVLMNLLIGLAVGDIELIRKTADMRKIAAQIEFLKRLESRYPRIIARWFYMPEYSDKPNCRATNCLRAFFFGSDMLMDGEEEEEMSAGKELLQRYLTLDKKLGKTKQQVKTVAGVLEKQTKLLSVISTKMKLDLDEKL